MYIRNIKRKARPVIHTDGGAGSLASAQGSGPVPAEANDSLPTRLRHPHTLPVITTMNLQSQTIMNVPVWAADVEIAAPPAADAGLHSGPCSQRVGDAVL